MLSRILPDSADEAHPVPWRTTWGGPARVNRAPAAPRAPAPEVPPPPPPPSNADLEAQVHQQLELAFETGRKEGEAAVRQQLEGEVRRATEQLAQAAAQVSASRTDVIRRAETDILQLSIEIARRILHRELSIDPAALSALIRAALDKLASQQVSRVRVHPDQEQLVRASLAQIGRDSDIEVTSDATQPRGGALFETDSGSLDASVETQLREIERGFADRLQERA
jgi:flagellar assembly protein FliH